MSAKPVINIDVTSDNVCPWCYVGKRRLEQAIQKSPQYDFKVTWSPYFLKPDMPKEGIPIKEYIARVYGRIDPSRQDYLKNAGKEVGINFYEDRLMIPTMDSHRLVEYAKKHGKQDQVISNIFRSYFEDGKNIADQKVLVDIARESGLDPEAVQAYLATDVDVKEIATKDREAKSKLVSGVPHFTIYAADGNGKKTSVSGAQPPEEFLRAFQKAA